MRLNNYLALVDATVRVLREDKRGQISATAQHILKRFNIDENHWFYMIYNFLKCFT
jgi:hypothetical protein